MIATNQATLLAPVIVLVENVTEVDNVGSVMAGDMFQIMMVMMKNVGIAEVAANVDFVEAKAITDKKFCVVAGKNPAAFFIGQNVIK